MKRPAFKPTKGHQGPTQRQLRAGELIRHALADILRAANFQDEDLVGVTVTVTEVRMSPDLRHATCFIEPLGGADAVKVVKGMNRGAKFLRGQLGHVIDMRFTPELKFLHDESFDAAARMDALLSDPRIQRDVTARDETED